MSNVLRILQRDFKRLFKAPAALVVVGALLVLPSLYTWYNVLAFWDPYNSTGNLKVCVVNQDVGAKTEMTGQLTVGDTVAEELLANDMLAWVQEDYDTAIDDLMAGRLYAVYVIPEDFTACLVSPLTGEVKRPQLQYFVNEKLGPVSPKITDIAASTIEETINSMFVATVSEVAVDVIDDAMKSAKVSLEDSKSKVDARMGEVRASIAEVRDALSGIQEVTGGAKDKVNSAIADMDNASALVANAQAALNDVSAEASAVQDGLTRLSTDSIPALSRALSKASQVTAKASTAADGLASMAGSAQVKVDMAVSRIQPVVDAMRKTADALQDAAADVSDETLKASLLAASQDMGNRADQLQSILDQMVATSGRIAADSQAVADAANALNDATQQAASSPQEFADKLFGGAASSIDSALAQVEEACSRLSAAATNLDISINEAKLGLTQLNSLLDDCETAVSKTSDLIGDTQSDLDSAIADIRLLAQSNMIADLVKGGNLNSRNISEFMQAPTQINKIQLYHPNAYGSAMAPLFMNLTFWIGAFMLVIIFRLEVDSEGVDRPTLSQRYLSRFFMFCIFVVLQAVICCIGTLLLGVQAANVPALFVASSVASLAYMSIIYALSTTFRHVGKALCIVLVFAQIPGGSGLYPIEMTSSFFQSIYPFLPFSYGIDAMRESIGGLYGSRYALDLLALGAFFVGSLVLGLAIGPLMSNVTRMAADQIRAGGLYGGEDIVTPMRPYRLTQVLRALSDREEYRHELEVRRERFNRRYPVFIKASIVLGVGVPVLLCFLLALNAAEKVTLLTLFLIWLIALFATLVIVESLRYSYERQMGLEHMGNDRLLRIYSARNHMTSAEQGATVDDSLEGDEWGEKAPTYVRGEGGGAEKGADDE